MSDRTPADVIAKLVAEIRQDDPGAVPDQYDCDTAGDYIKRLAAAGYRVVPIPDDDTRAARIIADWIATWHDSWAGEAWTPEWMGEQIAAALAAVDGQPQARPATCPTCGNDDPADEPVLTARQEADLFSHAPLDLVDRYMRRCYDPWHTDGTGDES